MTKENNPLIIIGIIIAVALLYKYSSLGAISGLAYIYSNPVTIISETNEYVEYHIPFSILHGNIATDSCGTGTEFDITFKTNPSSSYFDARQYTGSEMTIPISSPLKNLNIEQNREFEAIIETLSASAVWNPCAGTTTGVNIVPHVTSICKVQDYTEDKQNIQCKLTGYFNGISSNPLPDGTPENTEITGNLKVTSFSGGTIKVKMYKIGYPIIQNITYYRFSNNACSQISIPESQKTSNDYLTSSECQSKIIIPLSFNGSNQTNNISTYRFSNNTCSLISIIPPKTSNDYDALSECQANILCYNNSDCSYTCGSKVPSCISNECYCDDEITPIEVTQISQPQDETPTQEKSFFEKYKWMILIALIVGGFILINRKK